MKLNLIPFNIDLLLPEKRDVSYLKEIKVLDIFQPSSKNFHPDGLFSVEIFGRIGSNDRMTRFGYIDLKTDILHPILYKLLTSMNSLYAGIASGKKYAIWNEEEGMFELSNPLEGDTGMSFLIKHLPKIKYPTKEGSRKIYIDTLEKYRNKSTYSKLLVLPAGLRDYIVDKSGKAQEDEINGLYRRVLANVTLLTSTSKDVDNDTIYSIQQAVNEIYLYIENILKGKKGFVQGKWGSRRIFNGTRNVITSLPTEMTSLDDDRTPGFNETISGLYQYLKASLPMSIRDIKTHILSNVFVDSSGKASLVDPKTMDFKIVQLDNTTYSTWTSSDGMESIINKYGQEDTRHNSVKIGDYYLGLIWIGKDNTFKFITNKDEIPTDVETEELRPITYTEMFYISVYRTSYRLPVLVTRYPVVGLGGTYPSKIYLKTTVKSKAMYERLSDGSTESIKAKEFPVLGSDFINSISPHYSKLSRLYADFDGDTVSFNIGYTDDTIKEIDDKLNSKSFYIAPDGALTYSAQTDTIDYVLAYMTGG